CLLLHSAIRFIGCTCTSLPAVQLSQSSTTVLLPLHTKLQEFSVTRLFESFKPVRYQVCLMDLPQASPLSACPLSALPDSGLGFVCLHQGLIIVLNKHFKMQECLRLNIGFS
ncbi:hypothetical protein ATANTOWER_015490, partial [Ataeniobius toweri]|nr:hypothetical protein [Ataeniobius toweri]